MKKSSCSRRGRLSRRNFVIGLAGSAAAAGALPILSPLSAHVGRPAEKFIGRKRVALVATEVRKHSHAQHFIDRLLEGYGWRGRHYHPAIDLAALYVDQFPENDLSRDRARRHR